MKSPAVLAGAALAALAMGQSAHAADAPDDGGPAVVPYRPSVSTPAQLSAPGYLELEAGGLRATGPDSGTSRFTLPYTLKLAFTPDWGIRVGGDAWVRQAGPGDSHSGSGDTAVVLKRSNSRILGSTSLERWTSTPGHASARMAAARCSCTGLM